MPAMQRIMRKFAQENERMEMTQVCVHVCASVCACTCVCIVHVCALYMRAYTCIHAAFNCTMLTRSNSALVPAQEMMNDTIDDVMEEEGDEEEEDAIVGQVLAELGIEAADIVRVAPNCSKLLQSHSVLLTMCAPCLCMCLCHVVFQVPDAPDGVGTATAAPAPATRTPTAIGAAAGGGGGGGGSGKPPAGGAGGGVGGGAGGGAGADPAVSDLEARLNNLRK